MNAIKLEKLSLRERKYATTKVALLEALLLELEEKNLSEVKIRDLARRANVSEPTFFNYFDSKQHMLYYFIQIWATEMNAIAKESEAEEERTIEILLSIFNKTSHYIAQHPQIMLEIIAFHTQRHDLRPHQITAAEKWLFFPEIEGVETLEDKGLESIVPPLLAKAKATGELAECTEVDELFLTISSLFFGTALLLLPESPQHFPQALQNQLRALFKGITC